MSSLTLSAFTRDTTLLQGGKVQKSSISVQEDKPFMLRIENHTSTLQLMRIALNPYGNIFPTPFTACLVGLEGVTLSKRHFLVHEMDEAALLRLPAGFDSTTVHMTTPRFQDMKIGFTHVSIIYNVTSPWDAAGVGSTLIYIPDEVLKSAPEDERDDIFMNIVGMPAVYI